MADVLPEMNCPKCGIANPSAARFCGSCGTDMGGRAPQVGQVVADRYRIVEVLGRGGMGVVYKVEHTQIGKSMAMKLLHRDLEKDADTLRRFHREAESASKLSHPNTVQVFDFGRSKSGWMYLVMEHVDGPDFGQLVEREGPLPFGRVAYLCAQVAASIIDAHEAGIVHRDLKPENIMITEGPDGDMAKVLDFGLAKLLEDGDSKVTRTGTIIGTPYYMSPEQIRGEHLDGRSDIYSLGAVMYEAVIGEPPFDAPSPVGVLSKHLTEEPIAPSVRAPRSAPPEADRIILRAMEKDPADRYQTAEELREDLIAYLRMVDAGDWRLSTVASARSGTRPVSSITAYRKKRPGWVRWLLVGLVVAAGVGLWLVATSGPAEREPNHEIAKANPLVEGETLEAYLGRRIDTELGDQDVFRIDNKGREARPAEIRVSGIPNMDLMVELMDAPTGAPLLTANSRGVGEPELLPNLPIRPGATYLRVRENTIGKAMPTENVSDSYEIEWQFIEVDSNVESESNDSMEQAELLPMGFQRRAWLGWSGDVDFFCLDADAASVVAQVSALEGVDLILRLADRRTQKSHKHDANGLDEAETSKPWREVKQGDFCVEVSANEATEGARPAQPSKQYGVRFIPPPGR